MSEYFLMKLENLVSGAAGEKNMHDAEFTCALFRFIQLTCEGHNLGTAHQQYLPYLRCVQLIHLFISRMAKLPSYASRKHYNCECSHLHSRLLATFAGINYGLLLALF